MTRVKFEIHCVGCSESVKVVVVWVAVELDQDGPEFEGGLVLPEMVYESNGGNALCPEP